MLQMRPNCECCNKDLRPDSTEAMICSFECTFCRDCVEKKLKNVCPNCGSNFELRPLRQNRDLINYPASMNRVYKPEGCTASDRDEINGI
jgi:hypothetical protein